MKRFLLLSLSLLSLSCRKPAKVNPDPVDALPPPVVRVVADKQDHPWAVFVNGSHVYWTNKGAGRQVGALSRIEKKDGASLELLAEKLEAPYGIAVANGRVYWSAAHPGTGGLGSLSLVDKAHIDRPHRLDGLIDEPWSIVVSGQRIFFGDLHLKHIATAPLNASVDTSQVTILARTDGRPVGLAVDEGFVYWTDSDPGVIAKMPIEGGPIATLVAKGDKTTGLAVDATHVYFSEWGGGKIGRVLKAGGGIETLAQGQKGARSIAIDEGRVYWTHPPTGTIRSMKKSGGAVATHANDQKHPYSIAVDATSIYWANVDGGTVMSIEKRL